MTSFGSAVSALVAGFSCFSTEDRPSRTAAREDIGGAGARFCSRRSTTGVPFMVGTMVAGETRSERMVLQVELVDRRI